MNTQDYKSCIHKKNIIHANYSKEGVRSPILCCFSKYVKLLE